MEQRGGCSCVQAGAWEGLRPPQALLRSVPSPLSEEISAPVRMTIFVSGPLQFHRFGACQTQEMGHEGFGGILGAGGGVEAFGHAVFG